MPQARRTVVTARPQAEVLAGPVRPDGSYTSSAVEGGTSAEMANLDKAKALLESRR